MWAHCPAPVPAHQVVLVTELAQAPGVPVLQLIVTSDPPLSLVTGYLSVDAQPTVFMVLSFNGSACSPIQTITSQIKFEKPATGLVGNLNVNFVSHRETAKNFTLKYSDPSIWSPFMSLSPSLQWWAC